MSGLIRGVLTLLHHSICLYPSAGGPPLLWKSDGFLSLPELLPARTSAQQSLLPHSPVPPPPAQGDALR